MQLWDIQDALKAALESEAGTVSVDLSFPATLEKKHLWISGTADGEPLYEITGPTPSEETYVLTVYGLVTFAGSYEETREVLEPLWDAVTDAVLTMVPTYASRAEFGRWDIKEGVNDAGHRELGFSRVVQFFSG